MSTVSLLDDVPRGHPLSIGSVDDDVIGATQGVSASKDFNFPRARQKLGQVKKFQPNWIGGLGIPIKNFVLGVVLTPPQSE